MGSIIGLHCQIHILSEQIHLILDKLCNTDECQILDDKEIINVHMRYKPTSPQGR